MILCRLLAWAAVLVATAELCGREVARGSLLMRLTGLDLGLGTLVCVAVVAASAGALRCIRTARERVALLFATLFVAGVAAQLYLGARLQSDGFYYFAYLRSLAFDRDVEFSNDYRMLGLGDKTHLFQPTRTGHAQSAWTIGPAIVWSPFFAAAHPIAQALAARGEDVNTSGTSYPYRQAVCLAGLVYGLLGCWFSYRFVLTFFARRIAAAAVALTVCGSFMLWYLVKEPSMTHAPAFAGVAGFLWFWASTRGNRTLAGWAALGALAGFITLIRWQNALFAILPACDAIELMIGGAKRRDTLLGGLLFMLCATLAFTPQMLAWNAIYGSFLAVSPVGPEIRWWDPHLVDILWSSRNGLFSWSPILYCGAIGLLLFAWARPTVGVPMLVSVALMVYFNASIQDWWGSAGFGGRRFDGTIPLFALGVAALTHVGAGLVRRHPLRTMAAAGGLLVVWNLSLMSAANAGQVRIGESVSFGDTGAYQARAVHSWLGNPFTYPASLFFAARNDVPIGAYDVLSANRFLSDPLRPYGRIDIGTDDEIFISGNWHAPENAGGISFRWSDSPATVIIPLDHSADLRLQVRAQAFNYPGAAPQTLSAQINGRDAPPADVPPEWTTVVIPLDGGYWRSGVNRVTLSFSRSTRPADVGAGGDTRRLAAAIDYVRIELNR